jgi:hypothetical protein
MTKQELIKLFETSAVPFARADRTSKKFRINLDYTASEGWCINTFDLGDNNSDYKMMSKAFQPVIYRMARDKCEILSRGGFSSAYFGLEYNRETQTVNFIGSVYQEQPIDTVNISYD